MFKLCYILIYFVSDSDIISNVNQPEHTGNSLPSTPLSARNVTGIYKTYKYHFKVYFTNIFAYE